MKKYRQLIIIVVMSIITVFLLLRLGDIKISADTFAQVEWGWLGVSFVIFWFSLLARGWRWQRILKNMGWTVGTVYAQTLLISGLFISNIVPARAGDIARVAMLRQDHKIPVAQGIASIATERALDVFSILTLAIIGAVWALQGQIVPPQALQIIIGVTVLFVVGLLGLLIAPRFETWLRHPKLERLVPEKLWSLYEKFLDFGFDLIGSMLMLGKNPRLLAFILGESLVIWLCDALSIYVILIGIGVASPLSVSLFAGMIGALAAAVPIAPGALGQFDAALVGLLALFGISTAQGGLVAILLRFVNLWSFLAIGGVITYVFGFARALKLNKDALTETPSKTDPPQPSASPAK